MDSYASQYPDNPELALFKGLVAHYAYNLDLKEYYHLAVNSFQKAAVIDPTDYRVDWYWGVHLVKSNVIKEGMEQLLSVIVRTGTNLDRFSRYRHHQVSQPDVRFCLASSGRLVGANHRLSE